MLEFPFRAWHGTPHGPFASFRLPGDARSGADAIFVSRDRRVAEMYALSRHTGTGERAVALVRVHARAIFDYEDGEQVRALKRKLPRHLRAFVSCGAWTVIERDLVQNILRDQGYDAFTVHDPLHHGKNIGVFDPDHVEIETWHPLELAEPQVVADHSEGAEEGSGVELESIAPTRVHDGPG